MALPREATALRNLWQEVLRGEISPAEGLQRAERIAPLPLEVAVATSEFAFEIVRRDYDDWRPAVVVHSLLFAAWDATRPGDGGADGQLVMNWLNIVSCALWHVPDPRLFRDALERGERAAEWFAGQGIASGQASVLHGLGTIHLDPYAARRSAQALEGTLRDWRVRAQKGETWNGRHYGDIAAEGYPGPLPALERAAGYYTRAAALRQGPLRARSLKALAQALCSVELFDAPLDRDRIAEVATETLGLLDPETEAPLILEVRGYLKRAGHTAEDVVTSEWLERSLDASVREYGLDTTRLTALTVLRNLVDTDPARALRLAKDAQALFAEDARGTDHANFHFLALRAFAAAHGFDASSLMDHPEHPPRAVAEGLVDQANREHWDPARLAAGLASVVEFSTGVDQERFGLDALATLQDVAPLATAPLTASWAAVATQLMLNEGVNAVHRGDWDGATRWYAAALASATRQGTVPAMTELLERLEDVVHRGGVQGAEAVAEALREQTDAIELAGGEDATLLLQSIYRAAIEAVLVKQGGAATLWTLVQLARGRRFAAMLAAGSAQRFQPGEREAEALQRIEDLRHATGEERAPDTFLLDGALLSPYSRGSLRLDGSGPLQRRLNLQHRYDVDVSDALTRLSAGASGLLATEEAVRQALGDETVLLQYYFPAPMGADPRLVVSVTTGSETRWAGVGVAGVPRPMRTVVDGVEAYLSFVSEIVRQVRDRVREDPGADAVTDVAREQLAEMTRLLIAPIEDVLAACRGRGARHLCIAPHGPLNYAPLHLLGSLPRTLAGDWTVTYLPSLQLLASAQGAVSLLRRRSRTLAAFGVSFRGEPDAIPEAAKEAVAVAGAFGVEAAVDDAATVAAVLDAMRTARFVHVASHGTHEPLAPLFQTIRLAPDPGGADDGRLYAHQLIGLDLRGLELVTLGACETALGRFDAGDNLHGLAAQLLLAGAQTIVGTLWDVETTCSERFFTALYERLADGQSRLDAYQGALGHTRKHHPQFRDWGAFYYLGRWA